MQLYVLTESEVDTITALNAQRTNVLLIVCDYGADGVGVDPDALQQSEYSVYLDALGGVFDGDRVAEFDPPEIS